MLEPQTISEYENAKKNNMVVVKFTAPWCNICKIVQPKLDGLVKQFPNVTFISFDVESLENSDSEDITALPTFKIFNENKLIEAFAGDKIDRILKVLEQNTK
jgi:thiol-disulfide isomerase/thioredoxin